MKQTTRIIWKADKKLSKKGTVGYLYLSTRVMGKEKLKTTDLPAIDKKHWLKKSNRVSDLFPKVDMWDAEKINTKIEKKLNEAQLAHNDFKYLPDEKKSFTTYWQNQIDLTTNNGTKEKYENVRGLLLKYVLKEFTAVDVKFKDISPDFIKGFYKFLRTEQKNRHNTALYKLKSMQGMVNRAVTDNIYYYAKNPFDSYDYKFEETMIKDLLSLDELNSFINTEYYEVYRGKQKFGQKLTEKALNDPRYKHEFSLQDYRNFWLFQLFAQGLRVSDLLTLRWNDFKVDENNSADVRIVKRMVKTKHYVTCYLNDKLIDILTPYVQKFCEGQYDMEWYIRLVDISNEIHRLKEEELIFNAYAVSLGGGVKKAAKMAGPSKDKDRIKLINDLMFRKRTIVRDVIIQLSIHNKTSFVFGILKDKDFADVKEDNDFGTIKKWQYNKLIGTRAYYNRLLKCVAKQAGITKDMTAHLSRHSAVSLMVEMGIDINLFDIMNALGHKHITTTQTYLQKFTNKKLDKINKILSDAFESKWILGEDGKAYNSLQKPMVN